MREAKEREGERLGSGGGGWHGVKVAPGSSYFPSQGPAEVRRVTERELVSPSVLRAPLALIGWPESVPSLAASC